MFNEMTNFQLFLLLLITGIIPVITLIFVIKIYSKKYIVRKWDKKIPSSEEIAKIEILDDKGDPLCFSIIGNGIYHKPSGGWFIYMIEIFDAEESEHFTKLIRTRDKLPGSEIKTIVYI